MKLLYTRNLQEESHSICMDNLLKKEPDLKPTKKNIYL